MTVSTAAATARSTARYTALAITKGLHDADTAAYLARKQAEGKSRREALRCVKRYLARRVWHLLQTVDTTTRAQPPPNGTQ